MAQNSYHRHVYLEDITNEHLYLCHYGWHKCEPGHFFGPSIRDFYLIHIVTDGRGTFTARGKQYELHAGQSFIIRPGEITKYLADAQEPWTYYYFSFSGTLAPTLLNATGFKDDKMVVDILTAPLEKIIQKAVKRADDCHNKMVHGLSVLMSLINVYAQEADADATPRLEDSLVAKAKAYIDFNFSGKLTIAQIAADLNVSRSHLYKTFKDETGLSPCEYLSHCRIQMSAKLLEDTDLSIREIANAVGFDTYSAFFRAFKLFSGMSAIQYRKLAAAGALPAGWQKKETL
ncbi:MAG: AraC family transcriptional regulator [Clostridia bacterium]|nr:AraC family transcriptional regulator [Clostridia bacterium]